MTPCVDVVLRRRPQSTFYVNVRPWPHTGTPTWFFFCFWIRKILRNQLWGPSGALAKTQAFLKLVQDLGHKGPVLRPRCIGPGRVQNRIFYSVQFYSLQSILILSYSLYVCFLCHLFLSCYLTNTQWTFMFSFMLVKYQISLIFPGFITPNSNYPVQSTNH